MGLLSVGFSFLKFGGLTIRWAYYPVGLLTGFYGILTTIELEPYSQPHQEYLVVFLYRLSYIEARLVVRLGKDTPREPPYILTSGTPHGIVC